MGVHSGGPTGAQHHRRDVVAVQIEARPNGHRFQAGLVVGGDQSAGAVRLEPHQTGVVHVNRVGNLVGHRPENLSRRHPPCDQGGDPSQRCLLLGQFADAVGGPVGLVPAFLSFESTRADLTDERGGQRRDREKDCDRHHLGDVGRQEAAARADMEVRS